MTGRPTDATDATPSVADAIDAELADRSATAFVHVGSARDPVVRYCLRSIDALERPPRNEFRTHAVGYDGGAWYHRVGEPDDRSPAVVLADDLRDAGLAGPVLTPAHVPHDAALYLEEAGFSLASSDVLSRARAEKTVAERERIERAGEAAAAGLAAAATVLEAATVADDGRLAAGGDPLTADRLRVAADRAVVDAGAFPAGHTRVAAPSLSAGEPIVLALAPRDPAGYHAAAIRTLVVAGEGGDERRAHVAVTRAFRSAEALLSAERPVTIGDVERDLEAEIRAFGFEDGIETDVAGVGLDSRERPLRADAEIGSGAVVRLEAAVPTERGDVRLADCFASGEGWIPAPSRSLDPAALLED